VFFKPEFDSEFQVDVALRHNSVSPLVPLGRGEREPIFVFFKPEFDSEFQVDVALRNNSVSPLAPWGEG
jgi:hypothetical protein